MIDRSVSHYKFVERLGAGGMGEIYKAQDVRLNRTVAVKMVTATSAGDAEKRQRFLQEARAASGLNHPNIITVHDLVSDNDSEFLVMEYVAGRTLSELIRPGGMPATQVVDYALQISDALASAHNAGIVHRDIKPGNVMVGDSGIVKVLDFGLAKLTFSTPGDGDSSDESTRTMFTAMTVEGSILGTVSYMSPEQAEGKPVDARSDIFSFGVVLYEMLTGEKAFKGQSALSTLSAILRDDVRPITELAPGVPPALVQLTLRCLAKKPEDRWQSMRDINSELRHIKELSTTSRMSATLLTQPPAAAKPARSSKWTNAAAILVPGLVLFGVFWWISNRSTPQPIITEQPPATGEPEVKPAEDSLTNESVIDMVKAKVPTSVIVSHVRTAPFTNFDVSTAELIRLGKEGVPEPVIQAMSSRWRLAPPPNAKNGPPPEGSAKGPGATPQGSPFAPVVPPPPPGTPGAKTEPPAAAASAPPSGPTIPIQNGTPFEVILSDSVPEDATVGTQMSFKAKQDLRINGALVIPAGSPVRGEIVEAAKRRFPGLGGRIMFRLYDVATPGGTLKLRAIPGSQGGDNRRPIDNTRAKPSKGMAADAGFTYIAYVDGDQTVPAPR